MAQRYRGEDLSSLTAWGSGPGDSERSWRRGFKERIESSWDGVWVGDARWPSLRVVRVVIRDFSKSHDEMLHPSRRRWRNFGKWYREKKAETSTVGPRVVSTMNDSTLLDRVSSPSTTIEDMMELRVGCTPEC